MRFIGRVFAIAIASFCLVASPAHAQGTPGKAAYDIGVKQNDEKRYDEARISFNAACSAGYLKACAEFALLLEVGNGGQKDVEAALNVYSAACSRGDPASCAGKASVLRERKQYSEALTLAVNSCAQGVARACSISGNMYKTGQGSAVSLEASLKAFEKGCQIGSDSSCYNIGMAARHGLGRPKNDIDALAILKRNCDASGYIFSCYQTARIYGESDATNALKYYQKACTLRHSPSCHRVGSIYYSKMARSASSTEISRNARLAKEYYSTACKLGRSGSCGVEVRSAQLLEQAKNREILAEWDAKSKATIRKLNAYRPRDHGCNFFKFEVYSNSQASIDRGKRYLDEDFACIKEYYKSEARWLNGIMADSQGLVEVRDMTSNNIGRIYSVWREGCKCRPELTAAVNRLDVVVDGLMDRQSRRIGKMNNIIRNGY